VVSTEWLCYVCVVPTDVVSSENPSGRQHGPLFTRTNYRVSEPILPFPYVLVQSDHTAYTCHSVPASTGHLPSTRDFTPPPPGARAFKTSTHIHPVYYIALRRAATCSRPGVDPAWSNSLAGVLGRFGELLLVLGPVSIQYMAYFSGFR